MKITYKKACPGHSAKEGDTLDVARAAGNWAIVNGYADLAEDKPKASKATKTPKAPAVKK